MVDVRGMSHSQLWYSGNQQWADVNQSKLRNALRSMYEDSKLRQSIGENGKTFVKETFNLARVGKLMAERLAAIEKELV